MSMLFEQTALVTGGSRGIGESIVRKFAHSGAKVVFTYLSSAERAERLAAELTAEGCQVTALRSDAADYAQSEALIEQALSLYGSLEILVNNAGITRDNLLLRMSPEQWDEVMHSNLRSVFNLSKLALKPMMKQRKGSIINLSSIVGITGNAGQTNYAASKAGIIGFTKSLAQEMGKRGIRCNAIAPGFIETEMTDALDEATRKNYLANIPLGRFGTGEEIANVALFLASDLSAYLSGQTLSVCGALNT